MDWKVMKVVKVVMGVGQYVMLKNVLRLWVRAGMKGI